MSKIKWISCLVMVSMLMACAAKKEEYSIHEPYQYPVKYGSEEWENMDAKQLKKNCYIPEDIISEMDTQALAQNVVEYPFLCDIFLYRSTEEGIKNVGDLWLPLKALSEREDAYDALCNVDTQSLDTLGRDCLRALMKYFKYHDLKVEYAHGDFAIDMDNPYQVVGSADYCFVARVDAVEGVEYRDVVEKETSLTETEKVGTPYTKYKVTILQNIKGKLSRNTPITVTKFGGIKEDQKSVLLFEGDALMEEGNVYVLLAHKQPDGSLLTCGPNTTVEVTDLDDTKNVTTTKELKSGIIEKYKEYYLHEEKVE